MVRGMDSYMRQFYSVLNHYHIESFYGGVVYAELTKHMESIRDRIESAVSQCLSGDQGVVRKSSLSIVFMQLPGRQFTVSSWVNLDFHVIEKEAVLPDELVEAVVLNKRESDILRSCRYNKEEFRSLSHVARDGSFLNPLSTCGKPPINKAAINQLPEEPLYNEEEAELLKTLMFKTSLAGGNLPKITQWHPFRWS